MLSYSWRRTSTRAGSNSWTSCRRPRPGRSSASSCGRGSADRSPGRGGDRRRQEEDAMSYRKQMTRVACALAGAFALAAGPAFAQGKVKVGFMLPYTGTYAALGNAITNGFKLAVAENGGKLGG